MPGDKTFLERQACNATSVVVTAKHSGAEESLMQPLACRDNSLRRTSRRGKHFNRRFIKRGEATSKLVRSDHEPTPIVVELVPDFPIKSARVCEPRHISRGEFRIKGTEIAKFSCNRCWGSLKRDGKFLNLWIARCDATEGNAAIQLKRKN